MLVGAAVLHVASLGVGEVPTIDGLGPVELGAILYLGVFSTAIAFFIYFTILESHGAFEAGLVAYLVPVVATLAGVFLLGEAIDVLAILGFGLVAVGFVLLKRRALRDAVESLPAAGGL
jgi:drug/metabolite transporter (DMT)-like permease